MNALIITDTTAVRMNVIAQRAQNLLVAGAKAMMIESLKDKLRNGVAHFIFIPLALSISLTHNSPSIVAFSAILFLILILNTTKLTKKP